MLHFKIPEVFVPAILLTRSLIEILKGSREGAVTKALGRARRIGLNIRHLFQIGHINLTASSTVKKIN